MPRSSSRYTIVLLDEGDLRSLAAFPWDELPTPGLVFERPGERWRVVDVAVLVPRTERQPPHMIECTARLEARWNAAAERWEKV